MNIKENEKAKQKGLFNKGKGRNLQEGWGSLGCTDRLGNEGMESRATERDLGSCLVQS